MKIMIFLFKLQKNSTNMIKNIKKKKFFNKLIIIIIENLSMLNPLLNL